MLIRRPRCWTATVTDIRVGARIDEVGDGLVAGQGEGVLYAGGGTVLPGLHDHHVHLRSAASALDSFFVGPPGVSTKAQLAQLLSNADAGPRRVDSRRRLSRVGRRRAGPGRSRCRGARHSGAHPAPQRCAVDPQLRRRWAGSAWPNIPTGACAAPTAAGRTRCSGAKPTWPNSAAESPRPASPGVTDATPDLDADDMVSLLVAHRRGEFRPRLRFLAPGKKILHDDRLDLDSLTEWIADQHSDGRPVAVHCVTAAQLVVTIAALRAAGSHPLDRIEHAAVVPDDNLADLADLGVTVVTQPNFVAERGDQYLADVPAAEHGQLWRVASLLKAAVPVALSTDMPFGHGDPWTAMRAAVHRTTPQRRRPQCRTNVFRRERL